MSTKPCYLELFHAGELKRRITAIEKLAADCSLCPRNCRIDRRVTTGKCSCSLDPVVSSVTSHFGEEPPLVGYYGSGTIFFTNCNMNCIYCQNYDISQLHLGQNITYEALADLMIKLQDRGCHNINLVSPTHQIYAILKALELAANKGLRLPLVYNSGGYDAINTLKLLDGIIDIYMPDFKYINSDTGKRLSHVNDYPEIAMLAIKEMYRQVGDLQIDEKGVACHGLIIRHLILPGYLDESIKIIDFIASVSRGIYLNVMDQYQPAYRSDRDPKLTVRLSSTDYDKIYAYAVSKEIRLAE